MDGMSKRFIDLTGNKYNRLTVVKYHGKIGKYQAVAWLCVCDCGKHLVVSSGSLKSGKQQSCGCYREEFRVSHGGYRLRAFRIWATMKQRCLNPKVLQYKDYGARGILVCDRWLDFKNFLADMGEAPKEMSIERLDVNGNYEPSNCVWATMKIQGRNRRTNHIITAFGQSKSLAEFAEEYKLEYNTLASRIKKGWEVEKALLTPTSVKFRNKLSKTK